MPKAADNDGDGHDDDDDANSDASKVCKSGKQHQRRTARDATRAIRTIRRRCGADVGGVKRGVLGAHGPKRWSVVCGRVVVEGPARFERTCRPDEKWALCGWLFCVRGWD